MPCSRHIIESPGQVFHFQITDAQNVFAGVGRLRTTGPTTGHSQDFTFDELQAGIDWDLEANMSYTLRVIVQPHDSNEAMQITAQTSAGVDTCSLTGAGQIAQWAIDVI